MQKVLGVHGLRAVAAVGIVGYHLAYVPHRRPDLPPVIANMVPHFINFVPLFFVISAFALVQSYYSRPHGEGWVRDYMVRRVFRIGPLFWSMLVFYAIIFHRGLSIAFLANVFFVFNFFPALSYSLVWAGWSIGVEMPFYACLPMVVKRITTLQAASILMVILLFVSLASRVILERLPTPGLFALVAFTSNVGIFAVGVAAFFTVRSFRGKAWLWTAFRLAAAIYLVCLAARLIPFPASRSHWDELPTSLALGALCAAEAGSASWIMSRPFLHWIADRSFSIYLIHPLVIFYSDRYGLYDWVRNVLAFAGPWSYIAMLALTLAIVISLAAVTYALIEVPGQKLGNIVINALNRPSGAAVPVASES